MTQTVGEILDALGRVAPWDKAAEWDPVGLQFGDPSRLAGRVAVCHEVTPSVVDRLAEFDLVITYHPLVFHPLRRIVSGGGPGGRVLHLIEHRTAVAAVHTNFDAATGGTADALADSLGLDDIASFAPLEPGPAAKVVVFVPAEHAEQVAAAMAQAGGGRIGDYTACSFRSPGTGTFLPGEGATPTIGRVGTYEEVPEVRLEMLAPAQREAAVLAAMVAAHPYEEPAFDMYQVRSNHGLIGRVGKIEPRPLHQFADQVKAVTGGVIRVAGTGEVHRVGVVPGSGAGFIEGAAGAGADVLVTGDVSHHRARAALDLGLRIVDPGHVPTERPGLQALYSAVAEMVAGAEFVEAADADPWERH